MDPKLKHPFAFPGLEASRAYVSDSWSDSEEVSGLAFKEEGQLKPPPGPP